MDGLDNFLTRLHELQEEIEQYDELHMKKAMKRAARSLTRGVKRAVMHVYVLAAMISWDLQSIKKEKLVEEALDLLWRGGGTNKKALGR